MEAEDESTEEWEALRKELLEEQVKSRELLTRLKYAQADLENYRKRADKEISAARDSSIMNLVGRLLPVLDELDLAVTHAAAAGSDKSLAEGFRMVEKNLESALESVGVERIDALGKPFDPALHEAVEKEEGEDEGDQMVVEEIRPGYTLRGTLLRPSAVKVGAAKKDQGNKQ